MCRKSHILHGIDRSVLTHGYSLDVSELIVACVFLVFDSGCLINKRKEEGMNLGACSDFRRSVSLLRAPSSWCNNV